MLDKILKTSKFYFFKPIFYYVVYYIIQKNQVTLSQNLLR